MNSNSSIFRTYDPLNKTAPFYIQHIERNEKIKLSIRPVWIIGDLKTLHIWLSSADKKTNWNLDLNQQTVYQRYKTFLLSNEAQSLMVEQNDQPLIQFDLLPGQGTLYEFTQGQLSIDLYFLFQEQFRDQDLFKKGLQCVIAYAFSFAEVDYLSLRLLKPDNTLSAILIEMGFDMIHAASTDQLPVQFYRLIRN